MTGKVLGIVQARIGSTRLPHKVMLPLGDRSMLAQCIRRLQAAKRVDEVVLSTADTEENRPLLDLAKEAGVRAFAGSETDLADRFYQTAQAFGGEVIVRITADCPLVDPGVVDRLVERFQQTPGVDLVTNNKPSTFPHGLDTEVMSLAALARIWREAEPGLKREWFTLNFHEPPGAYRVVNVPHSADLTHMRWTVDFPEDMEFVRQVFAHLDRPDRVFGMDEVLDLLKTHPEIGRINAMHCHTTVTHSFSEVPERDRKAHQ
jgi:spore coat polysaccharide biosynthesis protein SpsF (cytidylyltransferase family)